MADCNISVSVRVRRLIERELNDSLQEHWRCDSQSLVQVDPGTGEPSSAPYVFDRVYAGTASNTDVYCGTVNDMVLAAMAGFNSTIFAYGQTSSGKTHTMMGRCTEDPGMIPRVVNHVFDTIEQTPDRWYLLRVSYMEIYREEVADMLAEGTRQTKGLRIHEDAQGQVYVADLKEVGVNTPEKVLALMEMGEAHRHFGITNMNDRSSRSHTIFRIIIESRVREGVSDCDGDDNSAVTVSHLNLVDLAGSERARQTGATGDRFREGCSINSSLFELGNVISRLSEGAAHISYRNSKLTRILQSSLGGNAKTAIICTVTPAAVDETHSTLRFASRAKTIKNKPHVNEVLSDAAHLRRLTREMQTLKQQLERHKSASTTDHQVQEMAQALAEESKRNDELQQRLRQLMESLVVSSVQPNSQPAKKSRQKRRMTWSGRAPNRLSMAPPSFMLAPIDESSSSVMSPDSARVSCGDAPLQSCWGSADVADDGDLSDTVAAAPQCHVTTRKRRAVSMDAAPLPPAVSVTVDAATQTVAAVTPDGCPLSALNKRRRRCETASTRTTAAGVSMARGCVPTLYEEDEEQLVETWMSASAALDADCDRRKVVADVSSEYSAVSDSDEKDLLIAELKERCAVLEAAVSVKSHEEGVDVEENNGVIQELREKCAALETAADERQAKGESRGQPAEEVDELKERCAELENGLRSVAVSAIEVKEGIDTVPSSDVEKDALIQQLTEKCELLEKAAAATDVRPPSDNESVILHLEERCNALENAASAKDSSECAHLEIISQLEEKCSVMESEVAAKDALRNEKDVAIAQLSKRCDDLEAEQKTSAENRIVSEGLIEELNSKCVRLEEELLKERKAVEEITVVLHSERVSVRSQLDELQMLMSPNNDCNGADPLSEHIDSTTPLMDMFQVFKAQCDEMARTSAASVAALHEMVERLQGEKEEVFVENEALKQSLELLKAEQERHVASFSSQLQPNISTAGVDLEAAESKLSSDGQLCQEQSMSAQILDGVAHEATDHVDEEADGAPVSRELCDVSAALEKVEAQLADREELLKQSQCRVNDLSAANDRLILASAGSEALVASLQRVVDQNVDKLRSLQLELDQLRDDQGCDRSSGVFLQSSIGDVKIEPADITGDISFNVTRAETDVSVAHWPLTDVKSMSTAEVSFKVESEDDTVGDETLMLSVTEDKNDLSFKIVVESGNESAPTVEVPASITIKEEPVSEVSVVKPCVECVSVTFKLDVLQKHYESVLQEKIALSCELDVFRVKCEEQQAVVAELRTVMDVMKRDWKTLDSEGQLGEQEHQKDESRNDVTCADVTLPDASVMMDITLGLSRTCHGNATGYESMAVWSGDESSVDKEDGSTQKEESSVALQADISASLPFNVVVEDSKAGGVTEESAVIADAVGPTETLSALPERSSPDSFVPTTGDVEPTVDDCRAQSFSWDSMKHVLQSLRDIVSYVELNQPELPLFTTGVEESEKSDPIEQTSQLLVLLKSRIAELFSTLKTFSAAAAGGTSTVNEPQPDGDDTAAVEADLDESVEIRPSAADTELMPPPPPSSVVVAAAASDADFSCMDVTVSGLSLSMCTNGFGGAEVVQPSSEGLSLFDEMRRLKRRSAAQLVGLNMTSSSEGVAPGSLSADQSLAATDASPHRQQLSQTAVTELDVSLMIDSNTAAVGATELDASADITPSLLLDQTVFKSELAAVYEQLRQLQNQLSSEACREQTELVEELHRRLVVETDRVRTLTDLLAEKSVLVAELHRVDSNADGAEERRAQLEISVHELIGRERQLLGVQQLEAAPSPVKISVESMVAVSRQVARVVPLTASQCPAPEEEHEPRQELSATADMDPTEVSEATSMNVSSAVDRSLGGFSLSLSDMSLCAVGVGGLAADVVDKSLQTVDVVGDNAEHICDLQRQLDEKTAEIQQLTSQLEVAEKQLRGVAMTDQQRTSAGQLQQQLARVQTELSNERDVSAGLRALNAECFATNDQLRQLASAVEAELADRSGQLAATRRQLKPLDEIREQLHRLTLERDRLQRTLSDAEDVDRQALQLERQLRETEGARELAERQQRSVELKLDAVRSDLVDVQATATCLRSDLAASTERVKQVEAEVSDLKSQLTEAFCQEGDKSKQLTACERQLAQLRTDYEALSQRAESDVQQLRQQRTGDPTSVAVAQRTVSFEITDLSDQLQLRDQLISELRQSLERLGMRKKQLEEELAAACTRAQELASKMENLQMESADRISQLVFEADEKEVATLEVQEECARLQGCISDLERRNVAECESLRQRAAAECDALQTTVDKLQSELEGRRRDLVELVEQHGAEMTRACTELTQQHKAELVRTRVELADQHSIEMARTRTQLGEQHEADLARTEAEVTVQYEAELTRSRTELLEQHAAEQARIRTEFAEQHEADLARTEAEVTVQYEAELTRSRTELLEQNAAEQALIRTELAEQHEADLAKTEAEITLQYEAELTRSRTELLQQHEAEQALIRTELAEQHEADLAKTEAEITLQYEAELTRWRTELLQQHEAELTRTETKMTVQYEEELTRSRNELLQQHEAELTRSRNELLEQHKLEQARAETEHAEALSQLKESAEREELWLKQLIDESDAELKEVQERLETSESASMAERQRLEVQLADLRSEIESLHQQLGSAETNGDERRQQLEQQVRQLQREIRQLVEEQLGNRESTSEADTRESGEATDGAAAVRKVEQLKQELVKAVSARRDAERRLFSNDMPYKTENQTLKLQLESLQREVGSLKEEQENLISGQLDETAMIGRAGRLGLRSGPAAAPAPAAATGGVVASVLVSELRGVVQRQQRQITSLTEHKDKYRNAAKIYKLRQLEAERKLSALLSTATKENCPVTGQPAKTNSTASSVPEPATSDLQRTAFTNIQK